MRMQIKRKDTWKMYDDEWCPDCGKNTKMSIISTGLPGMQYKECECGKFLFANFKENGDDILDVPEEIADNVAKWLEN